MPRKSNYNTGHYTKKVASADRIKPEGYQKRHMSADKALECNGWKSTPHGRYIDPETQKSYTAQEAWQIVDTRGR